MPENCVTKVHIITDLGFILVSGRKTIQKAGRVEYPKVSTANLI